MEYSLKEAYKLTVEHNKETNVKESIPGDASPAETLALALKGLQANVYNVSISHPLITLEKFRHASEVFNYYSQNMKEWNDKGLYCDWSPVINCLQFFRSKEQMDSFLSSKTGDGIPFAYYSVRNVSYIDLYTGGCEVHYRSDGKIDRILFDTIKKD